MRTVRAAAAQGTGIAVGADVFVSAQADVGVVVARVQVHVAF